MFIVNSTLFVLLWDFEDTPRLSVSFLPVWLVAWRHHAITWNNADILSIGHVWTDVKEILQCMDGNAFGNIACKVAAILFRPQCITAVRNLAFCDLSTVLIMQQCSVGRNCTYDYWHLVKYFRTLIAMFCQFYCGTCFTSGHQFSPRIFHSNIIQVHITLVYGLDCDKGTQPSRVT